MGLANKKELVKRRIRKEHKCHGACQRCAKQFRMIDTMCEANIPVGYWRLKMKNFKGPASLSNAYKQFTADMQETYLAGDSICFFGGQGTGKTMTAICMLKAAMKSKFSIYYTTASDILNEMTDYKNNSHLRQTLKTVDFLVIDELDSRFFVSDSTKELFASIYENIFRFRTHNCMPTIICTNETQGLLNVFGGMSAASIASLNNQYLKMCPVAGKDFRREESK